MTRNQFENKYSNFNIHKQEMERKWRVYEEEMLLMEAIEAKINFDYREAIFAAGPNRNLLENGYVVDDFIDDYFI
jgi:hypothetical protein